MSDSDGDDDDDDGGDDDDEEEYVMADALKTMKAQAKANAKLSRGAADDDDPLVFANAEGQIEVCQSAAWEALGQRPIRK